MAGWLFGTGSQAKKNETEQPGRDGLEDDPGVSPAVLERMRARDDRSRKAMAEKNAGTTEDVKNEVIIIDSTNWLAWSIFDDCKTQWRAGMGGRYALDYNVVFSVMDAYQVRDKVGTLKRIRLIENGALAGMNGITREEMFDG